MYDGSMNFLQIMVKEAKKKKKNCNRPFTVVCQMSISSFPLHF